MILWCALAGTKLGAWMSWCSRTSMRSIIGLACLGIAVFANRPAAAPGAPTEDRQPVGPVSTIAFVTCVWMTVSTVAEILADRGVKLFIHPSHNVPGNSTAHERLDDALAEYKRRIAGV